MLGRTRSSWLVPGALAALLFLSPSTLEAQACLGFDGSGFAAGTAAVRREWSESHTGIGAAGGLKLGPVVATGRFLQFSVDRYDESSRFQDLRANVALQLPISRLSLCPVVTVGTEPLANRDFLTLPDRSKPVYGGGLAVGNRFGTPGSNLTIIPSLLFTVEKRRIDELIEGDIVIESGEVSGVLRGGVTVEVGRAFIRPYVALTTIDNSYMFAGVMLGVKF